MWSSGSWKNGDPRAASVRKSRSRYVNIVTDGSLSSSLTSHGLVTVSGSESAETQEDVYVASVETDRGVKEQLRLYDTKGLHDGQDLPKHYYSVADGFVLVYSIDSLESFRRVDTVKKEIDKSRDKKEACLQYFKLVPCEMYKNSVVSQD